MTEPPSAAPPRHKLGTLLGSAMFVVALAGAGALGWWLGSYRAADGEGVAPVTAEIADVLWGFDLPTLEGDRVVPAELDAPFVLLDFWATWCSPCAIQAEILRPLHRHYEQLGGRFFAVNVAEEPDLVRAYVERDPFEYPVVLDRDGAVSSAAEIFGLPTVVVLDRDGNVVLNSSGLTGASKLREVLDQLVSADPS